MIQLVNLFMMMTKLYLVKEPDKNHYKEIDKFGIEFLISTLSPHLSAIHLRLLHDEGKMGLADHKFKYLEYEAK